MRISLRILIISLFSLLPLAGSSQFIQFSGYIYEKGTETPIPFANLINTRNRTGTISNASGFFTILLSPTDTVDVSAVGFKRLRYGLPVNIQPGSYSINIHMEKDIILLDSVDVRPYDLARFRDEFTGMPLQEEKKMVVGDPNVYKNHRATPETFGVRLNGPLSWLYNKMSRKSKELEKLRDLQSGDNTELGGSMRLNRDLVKEVTGLPDDEVDKFVHYCNFLNEDVAHMNTYDLRLMIKRCHEKYVADKSNIPPPPAIPDTIKN